MFDIVNHNITKRQNNPDTLMTFYTLQNPIKTTHLILRLRNKKKTVAAGSHVIFPLMIIYYEW